MITLQLLLQYYVVYIELTHAVSLQQLFLGPEPQPESGFGSGRGRGPRLGVYR